MDDEQLKNLINETFQGCLAKMSVLVMLVGSIGFVLMIPMINRNSEH
jgi:hypothetical protein